jgi:beta-ribofuranosylaminobenzene 5'-phosphate synthase
MQEMLIPAARRGDFAAFSSSLYHFGYQSGLSFASIQGGAYNGPRLQQIVETIQSLGITGVGQSSWGPTIFALCPDELSARVLAEQLRRTISDADITITATANHGARLIYCTIP